MQIPKPILDQITWDNRDEEPEHYRIKSLAPQTKPCENCGITVTDRRIIHKIYDRPYKHWRTKCFTCKKVRHPETGEFTLPDAAAFHYYQTIEIKRQKNN